MFNRIPRAPSSAFERIAMSPEDVKALRRVAFGFGSQREACAAGDNEPCDGQPGRSFGAY